MAILTDDINIRAYEDIPEESGIILELIPSNINFGIELQRAPDNNGTPGTFSTLVRYSTGYYRNGVMVFTDVLPVDGVYYWYRIRHFRTGYTESAWTRPIRFRATPITTQTDTSIDPTGGTTFGQDPRPETFISADALGAEDDALFFNGISITSGTFDATSADAPFTLQDVGKFIEIQGAGDGGQTLVSTIAAISHSASITIADVAFTTVVDVPFQFGTDNRGVIQAALESAATDSQLPTTVFLKGGRYLVDTRAATASIRQPSNTRILGTQLTTLVSLGNQSAPILTNTGSATNFVIEQINFDGDKDFHDSGSVALCIDGATDFRVEKVTFDSCSLDACQISGSLRGVLRAIRGNVNNQNDISAISSSHLVLDDVDTTGSLGYGVSFRQVVSSSLSNSSPSEEGSGSYFQDPGSKRIALVNVEGIDQKIRAQDIIVGRSGSLEEFAQGIVQEPFNFAVYDTFGLWNDESHRNFYGLGIQPFRTYTNPTIYSSPTIGANDANRYGIEFPVKAGKADNLGLANQQDSQSVGMFIGVNVSNVGGPAGGPSTDVLQLESGALEIRGDVIMGNTRNFGIANRPLFYRVTALSGSHTFSGSAFAVQPTITGTIINALTASLALGGTGSFTGVFTGSFTSSFKGEFDGVVEAGSRVYHELVDDGAQSSSFTMSLSESQFRKITAGADIGVAFSDTSLGQVSLVEIQNDATHSITLHGVSWNVGVTQSIVEGTNLVNLTQLSTKLLANVIARDIK